MDRKITPYVPFQTQLTRIKNHQRTMLLKRYRRIKDVRINLYDLQNFVERLTRDVEIEYPSSLRNRYIAFFFYISKIKNFLKAECMYPDVSMITFLESLSRSARDGNKFVIIVENEFFDREVLNLSYQTYHRSMELLEILKEDFGMFRNLEFVSMQDLNDEVPGFEGKFHEMKDKIQVNRDDEVYRVLRDSVSFKSLDHALRFYNSESTLSRVDKIYQNYMSFIEARNAVDYWGKIQTKYGWVRATVSRKSGIISINPTVFNIPAAHSIFNARILRDSYMIDELYFRRVEYRVKVDDAVMYYF
ncbi:MAG: hypothetical protein N3C61_00290 [Candidatus Micrarchaeota archaeon]|nr:hypothetical protein [Candidatus Micrarchaeota archaeon]